MFDGLLDYDDAREFFLDPSNKVYLDLVRKVWDSHSSNVFPQCKQINENSVLVFIIRKIGVGRPLGDFKDFAGMKKRDIYETLARNALAPLGGSLGDASVFEVFYRSFRLHSGYWGDLLPEQFHLKGKELITAFSAWLYGTVDGILGETLTKNKLNWLFRSSPFEAVLAPTSREKDDVDILILYNGSEIASVSVKVGTESGIRQAIANKRSLEKVADLYCGYFSRGGGKYFYGSRDGLEFDGLETFLKEFMNE